jgi:hypothetical protein
LCKSSLKLGKWFLWKELYLWAKIFTKVHEECKILFILERVDSSPKAQVVPYLEDEGHWKLGTFPKTRKLEMGCRANGAIKNLNP